MSTPHILQATRTVTREDIEAGMARGRRERSKAFHAGLAAIGHWLWLAVRIGRHPAAAPVPY